VIDAREPAYFLSVLRPIEALWCSEEVTPLTDIHIDKEPVYLITNLGGDA
jgi:hypothetical protein